MRSSAKESAGPRGKAGAVATSGAGVYATASTLTMRDDAIITEVVATSGGGVYVTDSTFTMRDDATCKAFWASIRATIRLREEFQYGPRFWKYAAVRPDAHRKPDPTRETGADAGIALLSGQLARGRSWLGA